MAALIVKVGAMNGCPLIWMVVECERLPLDPTMLRNQVVVPLKLSLTFTVALDVPFPLSVRMNGLIPTPNPTGGVEDEMVTFPAKPFRLVRLTVENPMDPAVIVRLEGEALIAKSGVAAGVMLAEIDAGTADTPPRRRKRDKRKTAVLKEDHGRDLRIARLLSFVVKTYDSLVFYQPRFESRS